MTMTPVLIAAVVGAIVSLLATFVPGFNAWFAGLPPDHKRAIMALAMMVVSAIIYLLACTPVFGFRYVNCPGGIWDLAAIVLAALVSNQSVDRATPEPQAVKSAKEQRG